MLPASISSTSATAGSWPGNARNVGAAARRREHSCGPRATTKGPKHTTVKLHAGRAVERARRDQDDPAQPLGDDAVARHRHPGAALHRDVPGSGAQFGDETFEVFGVDIGDGGRALDAEVGERGAQVRELRLHRSGRAALVRRRRR